MRTYSFCCTTVTKGQIAQILLLHVKKAGPDWTFTPRNSTNTKRMQISVWLLDIEQIKLQLLKESATNINSK